MGAVNRRGGLTQPAWTLSRMVAWATIPVFILGMASVIWMEDRIGLLSTNEDAFLLLGFGAYAVVGTILVAMRPENPISWIIASIAWAVGIFPAAENYAAYVMTTRGSPDALAVIGAWVNEVYWLPMMVLALVYLPMLFPDGRLPSRRWLPFALIPAISMLVSIAVTAFRPTLVGQNIEYQISNPIGISWILPFEQMQAYLLPGIFIGVCGAIAGLVYRFRRSRGSERQQIRWFLFAVALTPLLFMADYWPVVGGIIFGIVLASLPIAVAVAILRYHLYDIDLIIRRTIQYTLLTGLLVIIYFGCVVSLQRLFAAFGGQQSNAAVVLSTLAIAVLFTPLRRRVQVLLDRRFYRQKYDTEQVLLRFSASLRSEVDHDRLAGILVGVIEETVQPEQVSIWLPNRLGG
jgi:hypothetical protein